MAKNTQNTGERISRKVMLAHIATLTAALNYVVAVDENDNKITPELALALNALVQDTKNVFEFDGEETNFEVYADSETTLFEMWVDDGVGDVTGTFF